MFFKCAARATSTFSFIITCLQLEMFFTAVIKINVITAAKRMINKAVRDKPKDGKGVSAV